MSPDEFPDLVHSHNDISHSNPHIDSTLCPANESVVLDPVAPDIVPVRQSSRVHKPPTYLRDYHCNLVAAPVLASASLTSSNDSFAHSPGILYPLSSTLSYDKLSSSHKAFSISLTIHKEPATYAQAILDPRLKDACKLKLRHCRLITHGL